MTQRQETAARTALEQFRQNCQRVGTDPNRHDGVAAFMIAKALMRSTYGLKFWKAERWALDWLAINWK